MGAVTARSTLRPRETLWIEYHDHDLPLLLFVIIALKTTSSEYAKKCL
jgi:hypothetical protein